MKLELKKHDRICFLGDSITANGLWIREVAEYFFQNFADLEIGMYNCGIAGSKGAEANIKDRMFADCLQFAPKYVVVMFGMNDSCYNIQNSKEDEDKKIVEKFAEGFPDALKNIISLCKSIGATPIICSPTPYDEYNDLPAEILVGADKHLESNFAGVTKEVAEENGLIFVDMRQAIMSHIDEKPIGDDRVHPNPYGHHIMAERFLYTIGAKDCEEIEKTIDISEKNIKRFEIEQILRAIMFVERDGMGWQREDFDRTIEERKKLLAKCAEDYNDAFWNENEKIYSKYAEFKDELRGQLVKATLDMYK